MAATSMWKNVYPEELFNKTADLRHYRCAACNGVPIKPHQHQRCGHIFCEGCATAGIRRRGGRETTVLEYQLHTNFTNRNERNRMMTVCTEWMFCQGCEDQGDRGVLLKKFYVDRARMKDIGRLLIECPHCRKWRGQLQEFTEPQFELVLYPEEVEVR